MPDLNTLLASVDAAHDEIVSLLQDLVRIPTINRGSRPDTGNETLACDLLRSKLEPAGIDVEVHESAPGRGNLIARLGPTGGQRLLFMSHTDVVPVEDESLWENPPFSGAIDRGRVAGRGFDDDKADVAAHCMALVLLQRAGVRLGGELVCLAAADEESGGAWGAGWVAEHYAERVRADVAINEGGGPPVHSPHGLLYPVCTGEKGRLEAHITRQGRSGHASRPWAADNPVPVLAEAIQRIAAYEPEIDVSHPFFREVLSALGSYGTNEDQTERVSRTTHILACRFPNGAVALAPKLYMTGGLTAKHKSGVRAGLRFRYLGERPAFDETSPEYQYFTSRTLPNGAPNTIHSMRSLAVMSSA